MGLKAFVTIIRMNSSVEMSATTVTSTDAGIDEQHVELSRCQTRPQRGNLIWISNVDGRDFESTLSGSQ